MNDLPYLPINHYILIQDIKNETTKSGLYIPDDKYNRFAKVMKVYKGSSLHPGDIVVKPIGKTTPVKVNGVVYDSINEGFLFAKITDDETTND